MPFKHIVDNEKNIVVLKAKGQVSVVEIMAEIQEAIATGRGEGITRRLVDMTGQEIRFTAEDAKKILKAMKISAKALGSKKMAILLKEIPENFDFDRLQSKVTSPGFKIKLFTDKAEAARFLNESSKTERKN